MLDCVLQKMIESKKCKNELGTGGLLINVSISFVYLVAKLRYSFFNASFFPKLSHIFLVLINLTSCFRGKTIALF